MNTLKSLEVEELDLSELKGGTTEAISIRGCGVCNGNCSGDNSGCGVCNGKCHETPQLPAEPTVE